MKSSKTLTDEKVVSFYKYKDLSSPNYTNPKYLERYLIEKKDIAFTIAIAVDLARIIVGDEV